jgi:hypothetical protein
MARGAVLERVRGLELGGDAQQEILAAVRGDELDANVPSGTGGSATVGVNNRS